MIPGQHGEDAADHDPDDVPRQCLERGAAGAKRGRPQHLQCPEHHPEGVRQSETAGKPDRQCQADRHPQAVLKDGRGGGEVRANGAHYARGRAADPFETRRRHGQHDLFLRVATGRDHRIAAKRDGEVGDDPQRVIDVETAQHFVRRPAGP